MTILGTNGNDTLSSTGGSSYTRTVFGLNGSDDITYTGPFGTVFGGEGNDTIDADYSSMTSVQSLDWQIFGGSGNDRLTATTDMSDQMAMSIRPNVLVSGGQGDDTITVGLDIDLFDAGAYFYPSIEANTTVVDASGDNIVSISNSMTSGDNMISTATTVLMGGGADSVTIDNSSYGYNYEPETDHNIELGGGDDTLNLTDVIGYGVSVVNAGNGNDSLTTTLWAEEGNDCGLAGTSFKIPVRETIP